MEGIKQSSGIQPDQREPWMDITDLCLAKAAKEIRRINNDSDPEACKKRQEEEERVICGISIRSAAAIARIQGWATAEVIC